jgi:hypothetical protein
VRRKKVLRAMEYRVSDSNSLSTEQLARYKRKLQQNRHLNKLQMYLKNKLDGGGIVAKSNFQ